MRVSGFENIKKEFNKLSDLEKEKVLRDIYNFSKETKMFLTDIFFGKDNTGEFIRMIKKECQTNLEMSYFLQNRNVLP